MDWLKLAGESKVGTGSESGWVAVVELGCVVSGCQWSAMQKAGS